MVSHKTANTFFPRQLTVGDVMSKNPVSIQAESTLAEAARLLLPSIFTGLPVVDQEGAIQGILTQGDLINKGGLPLRLGLLAEHGPGYARQGAGGSADQEGEGYHVGPCGEHQGRAAPDRWR